MIEEENETKKIRELFIDDNLIKNILTLSAKDFAEEDEKIKYNFFNIFIEKKYIVYFEKLKECCNSYIQREWDYCPVCGEEVEKSPIPIRCENETKAKEYIKKYVDEQYIVNEIIYTPNIFLIMNK